MELNKKYNELLEFSKKLNCNSVAEATSKFSTYRFNKMYAQYLTNNQNYE